MPTPEARNDIQWGIDTLSGRSKRYELYRNYYDGKHRLAFATEKFSTTFGHLFAALADNLCPSVVDAMVDRLQLQGFAAKGNDALGQRATDIWRRNRMDRRSGEVHIDAGKIGDAYLLVWPEEPSGQARMWPQRPQNVCVRYAEEYPDRIEVAFKGWLTRDRYYRVNLYYRDRIEKYVTRNPIRSDGSGLKSTAFTEYQDEPLIRNEWGVVPVFHFANNAAVGDPGRSELRDVIPIQDALNKALADMLVAMEFHAFPQRWVTGLQPETDDEGRPVAPPFKPGADRIWTALSEAVKFGQFDPANLTGFLEVQNSLRSEIARISGTPPHYLMLEGGPSANASGEALKTAESRLVKKVEDRQVAYGNAWEDAMTLALRMERAGDDIDLDALWESPETRNELADAQIQQVKQAIGVSQQQSLRELGYTPEQIAEMAAEKEANADSFGMAALRAFDRDASVAGAGLNGA